MSGNGYEQQLTLAGCMDPLIAPMINGVYKEVGINHGKACYQRIQGVNDCPAFLYFWEQVDEHNSDSGWWVSPHVGSSNAWAYNTDVASAKPPVRGWRISNGSNAFVHEPVFTAMASASGVGSSQADAQSARKKKTAWERREQRRHTEAWAPWKDVTQ